MIYVTGDTHGHGLNDWSLTDGYTHRLSDKSFPEQKDMTKDDYVVILGDFGGVWNVIAHDFEDEDMYEYSNEEKALDWLNDRPFTTLFVPGNHENYDRLTGCKSEELLNCWLYEDLSEKEKDDLRKGYPRKAWHGGYVREIRPSVLMLEPGVFDIDGKKCFAYGGAQSHDISGGIIKPWKCAGHDDMLSFYSSCWMNTRIFGISWWPQEQPGDEEELMATEALDGVNNKVDFIFTHTPAASTQIQLGYEGRTRVDRFLEDVKQKVDFGHWFSGHLHMNLDLPGGKEHILYEQIIRIA